MSVAANQADVDIDLGRLVAAVWRRKRLIATITVVAAVAALLVTAMLDPLYKSETRLLIAAREPVYSGDQNRQAPEASFDERTVASQVEILKSADLIKKVAAELNLASYGEFDSSADLSAIERGLISLGLKSNPLDVPPGERILKKFREKLEVYVVESSRIIAIEFSSKDAELASNVTNALANAYLQFNSGLKIEDNTDASAWLAPEIDELRQKVRQSEEAVANYRADKGLLQVNERETIAARQLADISIELSRVRGEYADAEARARSVRTALDNNQPIESLGDVLGSVNVQRLRERESALSAQIADLSATLLNGHPRMKALRAQLTDVEAQVAAETRKVLRSLESNAHLAKLREEELVSQLNQLKSRSALEGEETVQLHELEREAAAQRDLLENYLARYRESASRSESASTPADARVISSAVPATDAYFPKTLPIITVAALAAFLLSSVWVMLAELLSGRALKPAEGADFIPHDEFSSAGNTSVNGDPFVAARSPASNPDFLLADFEQAGRASQTELDRLSNDETSDFSVEAVASQLLAEQTQLAIAVSPEGDHGSVNSVMLARIVAGEGARVLLVDLTASACPTELMAQSRRLPGLTDLLCGEINIAESIHADRLSGAQIVPHGNANVRHAMRAIDRLPMILDAFIEAYDLVIVECGATDAASVARIGRGAMAEIILSVVHPDQADLEATLSNFHEQGFGDVLLMTPSEDPDDPGTRRAVA